MKQPANDKQKPIALARCDQQQETDSVIIYRQRVVRRSGLLHLCSALLIIGKFLVDRPPLSIPYAEMRILMFDGK